MITSEYRSYDELPLFLNAKMVAKVLGVSPSSGYELMHEPGFPVLRVGSRMVVPKEQFTVATWLRTWYELYARPNVRTATANRYELIIEHYTVPRIGSVKLKKLTTRHLQKLYKELLENGRIHVGKNQDKGLSTTTVRSVHLMLHCALDRAVKERLIPRNPSEDCIVPKPRKLDMKILPPEHIHAYLKAAQARGLLPMFYLELAAACERENWWPCGGRMWTSRAGRSR